jgi:hypothetical protein
MTLKDIKNDYLVKKGYKDSRGKGPSLCEREARRDFIMIILLKLHRSEYLP